MYICANGNKILNELPRWETGMMKGKINNQAMVGMMLDVEYDNKVYYGVKILEYIKCKNARFITEYNGYIKKDGIQCGRFLRGEFKHVLNAPLTSVNMFQLIDDVLYIRGYKEKYGEWTALYSGEHVEDVMNTSWSIKVNSNGKILNVKSGSYRGEYQYLHRVDFENTPSSLVIDHINNNPLDNRKKNLRAVKQSENSKNKKIENPYGLTGIHKHRRGWYSCFTHKTYRICTKVNRSLDEAKLDNLIAQHYLGYKHNEDMFYLLDDLSDERICKVTNLLDEKIKYHDNKKYITKEYAYDIEDCDSCYILRKNGTSMLFDCDLEFIQTKNIYQTNGYWVISYIKNGDKIHNHFHKALFDLNPNEYKEYNIHIDHLNGNPSDNRYCNLAITTVYSNQCNKKGKSYRKTKSGNYAVSYMSNYRFMELIDGVKYPTFQTEQEAIAEIERRRNIVNNARVKLCSKHELDALIAYCFENNYIIKDGSLTLADLDLGYLYWKNFLL